MKNGCAACGSQVIYDGNRFAEEKKYQIGAGVCVAQLMRAGFKVISQLDYASLEILYSKLDPDTAVDRKAIDHYETEWFSGGELCCCVGRVIILDQNILKCSNVLPSKVS